MRVRVGGDVERITVHEQSSVLAGHGQTCDLVLSVPGVARRHCSLEVDEAGTVEVVDLGSAAGVFVGDRRLSGERAQVDVHDVLELGPSCTLALQGEPERLDAPEPLLSGVLTPHAAGTSAAARFVGCHLAPVPEGLAVVHWITGELDQLVVPTSPLDPLRLWEHTCAEVFVRDARSERYLEWNFSPTGQATRFEFERYRDRSSAVVDAPVRVVAQRYPQGLRIEARGPLLQGLAEPGRLSFTAVVRDTAGGSSFWALQHPGPAPDFHDPLGFVLDARSVSD